MSLSRWPGTKAALRDSKSGQFEAIQAIVERVGYDGAARQISIRFHPAAITAAGEEVGA